MRKTLGYLAICAFALATAGCSLAPVSGTMTFPDGSHVQYAGQQIETSAFNSYGIVATKTPDGKVETKVMSGTSVAAATTGVMSGVVQGLGTFGAVCAATGKC